LKKTTAILLLALLLFNVAGYRLFFEFLQQQHDVSLQALLDNHEYNDNELFEIKVPLSMPYLSAESSFERVDGELTIDGQYYKYVKRKVEKGQLILLCIPDHQKSGIDEAKTSFGGGAIGLPLAGKKNPESSRKNVFGSEYEESSRQLPDATPIVRLRVQADRFSAVLTPGFRRFAERPPQRSVL
jgi:hypothetical protein